MKRTLITLFAVLVLSGCAGVDVQRYAAETPALDLRRYFDGRIEGWGMFQKRSGEVVKLYVVKKDPSLSEEDIAAYCRENFTAYKRPKSVEFRDELPKTNVGKILRRELRGH